MIQQDIPCAIATVVIKIEHKHRVLGVRAICHRLDTARSKAQASSIFIKTIFRKAKNRHYFLICFSVMLLVAIAQPLLTGRIYGEAEAVDLLESIKGSSLYFGSAVATASATILALMLTLLSVTSQVETSFDRSTYKGIRVIGALSTITFIGSVLLLLLLSLPIGEYDSIGKVWYAFLYYVLCTLNGLLAGVMIFSVLILFETITTLISRLAPEADED